MGGQGIFQPVVRKCGMGGMYSRNICESYNRLGTNEVDGVSRGRYEGIWTTYVYVVGVGAGPQAMRRPFARENALMDAGGRTIRDEI